MRSALASQVIDAPPEPSRGRAGGRPAPRPCPEPAPTAPAGAPPAAAERRPGRGPGRTAPWRLALPPLAWAAVRQDHLPSGYYKPTFSEDANWSIPETT